MTKRNLGLLFICLSALCVALLFGIASVSLRLSQIVNSSRTFVDHLNVPALVIAGCVFVWGIGLYATSGNDQ